jgi:hypothetical protein
LECYNLPPLRNFVLEIQYFFILQQGRSFMSSFNSTLRLFSS